MLKALLAALGLPEDALEAVALAKINGLKTELATAANRAENPSLEKFVPRGDYDAAIARAANAENKLTEVKAAELETAVNATVDQALQDGKITPATKDYYVAQCKQDGGLERFKGFCAVAPVIGDASGLDKQYPEKNGKAMNAEMQKVTDLFGNSAEDIAKYGK